MGAIFFIAFKQIDGLVLTPQTWQHSCWIWMTEDLSGFSIKPSREAFHSPGPSWHDVKRPPTSQISKGKVKHDVPQLWVQTSKSQPARQSVGLFWSWVMFSIRLY